MRCEPFLCVGGVEIANALRTETYLREGFGGGEFSVGVVEGATAFAGYADIYSDLYVGDASTTSQLLGYCAAYDEGPYLSPIQDDAPWYQADRPESGEFLGLYAEPRLDPVLARSVTSRAPSGAVLAPNRSRQRVLNVVASMYAMSPRGMAWGERWLSDVLSGVWCADSDLMDVLLLPACPPDTEADAAFRTLRGVGCTDGPTFGAIQGVDKECAIQQVAFQLVAESPYLWHPLVTVLQTGDTSSQQNVLVTTDPWGGDATLKITLSPATQINGWRIVGLALTDGQTCPQPLPWNLGPCFDYVIPSLSPDQNLVIDGVARQASVFNETSKTLEDGLPSIAFEGLFHWPDIAPCSRVCISVIPGTGSAAATIEKHVREI